MKMSNVKVRFIKSLYRYTYNLGVSPNFEITVACSLKFHWYLRTRTKIEAFLSLPYWLSQFSSYTSPSKKYSKV